MSYLTNDLRNTLKNKYDKNQSTSVSVEALHEIQNVWIVNTKLNNFFKVIFTIIHWG